MTTTASRATATAMLLSESSGALDLRPGHSDYAIRVYLAPDARNTVPVGKRVRGVISGKALRIHANAAGGAFVEPLVGEPRIVCGRVLAVEEDQRRVLLGGVLPMWLTCPDEQDFGVFQDTTVLVNCYVESGLTFTPEGT